MTMTQWVRRFFSASPESPLSRPAQWLLDWAGVTDGITVTASSSVQMSAVYACVSLIARLIGSMPLKVYSALDRSGIPATDHPLYPLLHLQPNPRMTSAIWSEYLITSMLLRGDAYVAIGQTQGGRVLDLYPLHADSVTPELLPSGDLSYRVRLANGGVERLSADRILHIPGAHFDGVKGRSVIECARETIALAMATQQHGIRTFTRGTGVGLVLKHPRSLSKDAQERLRQQLMNDHRILDSPRAPLLLEEGMDVSTLRISNDDAQFLETRKFQVEEICRFFGVPPHMIGHTEKQTSWGSGVEQQTIGFLTFTLIPLCVRIEQEINRKLFPSGTHYAQYKHQGILRGDSSARAAYYASALQHCWMSPNEIRALEDLPPVEGGNTLFTPANLIPLERAVRQEVDNRQPV